MRDEPLLAVFDIAMRPREIGVTPAGRLSLSHSVACITCQPMSITPLIKPDSD